MIICVTLNPAIDKTVETDSFALGATNRVKREFSQFGGKGINFSAASAQLGLRVTNCMFTYADSERGICAFSDSCGFETVGVRAGGNLRVNLKIRDAGTGVITELNGRGDPVEPEIAVKMREQIKKLLPKAEYLVLTGSLPPGLTGAYYAALMSDAAEYGVRCLVDASGEALSSAVAVNPFVIKPNYDEFCGLLGTRPEGIERIAAEACKLAGQGIHYVCVSLGGKGSLIADANSAWFAEPLDVPVRGTTGAGDSMLAGICRALSDAEGPEGLIAGGCAAASASVTHDGTGGCTGAEYAAFKPLVKVKKLF